MTDRTRKLGVIVSICTFACANLAGCVKRKERIKVSKDGTVKIYLEYSGDREDMENGAPALARAPGWEFEQELVKKDDGSEEIRRDAKTRIPPGEKIPAVYPSDDPDAHDLIVRHPTTLIVEHRDDATYYHFKRIYEPRNWAHVNYWWNDLHNDYADKDPNKMSRDKQLEFVKRILEIERQKQLELIRTALETAGQEWAQELWLSVHDIVTEIVRSVDTKTVLDLLVRQFEDEEKEAEREMEQLAEQVETQITRKIRDTLADASVRRAKIEEFVGALQRERRRFAITEDYEDEEWDIRLTLPGHVVGHNGETMDDGRIQWKFGGERFFDRQLILLATSKVFNEQP